MYFWEISLIVEGMACLLFGMFGEYDMTGRYGAWHFGKIIPVHLFLSKLHILFGRNFCGQFEDFNFYHSDIRNWIRNIEQHASENVNKILVGNKADMDDSKRAVPTAWGQALADEFGIKFFETSAKTNMNVEEVFFNIGRDIKKRLEETDTKVEPNTIKLNKADQAKGPESPAQKSNCCSS